jgi:hypothetical protein
MKMYSRACVHRKLKILWLIGYWYNVECDTLVVQRGRFTRICVEIDLKELVVVEVWLDGYWYQVVFEGLCIISPLMEDTTTRLKILCFVQYLCQPHIRFNHAALEFG